MRSKEFQLIIDFCLDRSLNEPVATRVKLYLALAEFCGDTQKAAELIQLANDLRAADLRCREFTTAFGLEAQP